MAGLIYGFAAWVLIGRAGAATPNAIPDANLQRSPRSSSAARPVRRPRPADRHPARCPHRPDVQLRPVPGGRRPAVAAPRHRCPRHRRRRGRPVDPEGEGMSTIETAAAGGRPHPRGQAGQVRAPTRSCRPATWSSPSAASSASTASTSTSTRARSSRSSVTTAPASRPSSSASPAPTRRTPARSALDGQPGRLQASAGRPRGRHRDRLPAAGRHPGARHREQPLPRPRGAPQGPARVGAADARQEGHEAARRRLGAEARHPDDPEHGSGGRDALRWSAPGGRRGPRRGVREQGRRPRRADRGPGRQGVGDGPRAWSSSCATAAWPSS